MRAFALGFVLLPLATPGCIGKSCTEVGCYDAANLEYRSSALTAGRFAVRVQQGTTTLLDVDCALTTAKGCSDAAHPDNAIYLDPSALTVLVGTAAPSLHVRIARDGVVLVDKDVTVSYSTFAPNGESCGPICSSGKASL